MREVIKNFISGEYVNGHSKDQIDLYDPSKGEIYGYFNDSNLEDVERAIKSAKDAFPLWSKLSMDDI